VVSFPQVSPPKPCKHFSFPIRATCSAHHLTNIWQCRHTLKALSLNIYCSENLQNHTESPCRPLTVITWLCIQWACNSELHSYGMWRRTVWNTHTTARWPRQGDGRVWCGAGTSALLL
jgi:hypothetical protein